MAKRSSFTAVNQRSPAISVINELWKSHCVDYIYGVTGATGQSNKRPWQSTP